MSTGLMNLDCSGLTTENSAICGLFLIEKCDSVILVTLTAIFLSNIIEIERDNIELAASVKFFTGVTVTVVFHFDEWSTKEAIVFGDIGGTVILS